MSRLRRFVRNTVLMSFVGVTVLLGAYCASVDAADRPGTATTASVSSDLDIGWA
ncbi:hypothetical protein [Kitasatospora sp. NPDC097691]|uniref:hypothetical protein n=1 Tax=Kitasatospora sp. NPDC097691 TaxID=3157231 RepID=UPI0033345E99